MTSIASHPIDVHVGQAIRARRKELGLSQGDLARAADISFQQVQKYERGSNRVAASRLYDFSRALDVSVDYFFQDVEQFHSAASSDTEVKVASFVKSEEGLLFAKAFSALPASRRKVVTHLITNLADPVRG